MSEQEDLVMVHAWWDSGPFGDYQESDATTEHVEPPRSGPRDDLLVPRQLLEDYLYAQETLEAAKDRLGEACAARRKEIGRG